MGQAKRRGTFEQRRADAKAKVAAKVEKQPRTKEKISPKVLGWMLGASAWAGEELDRLCRP